MCKRREALYVEPDPVLVAMIADAKEKFRRELAEVTRFEPGSPEFEAADAMFRAAYRQVGRIEAAPGRPEHDAELVATIRRVREVQALGPVAWEELALGVVGVAPGTREHEACRAAIRWEAGRRRREETDRDRGRQDGRARAPRARGEL